MALACSALVALPMIAAAQDATWVGPGLTLNADANWSPRRVPDTGTAIFTGAGPLNPNVANPRVVLGGMSFAAGAPAHDVTIGPNARLEVGGAGIVNLSGRTQVFTVGIDGVLRMLDNASLGDNVLIRGLASDATARDVILAGNARGGTARIEGVNLALDGTASADRLTLVNGQVTAGGNATLGNATITLGQGQGDSRMFGNASLGAATITIPDGLALALRENVTGGTAAITVLGNGRFDLTGLNAARQVIIGSLAGDGRVVMGTGANTLAIDGPGGTFAGRFEGGGPTTAVDFRTGTHVLTGTSPYAGGYFVTTGATLVVDGDLSAASSLVVGQTGTLGGIGTVPETVLLGTLSPGNAASPIGTLRVAGGLDMAPSATTRIDLAASGADRINVAQTAALDGTLQVVPGAALPANGQAFTIVQAGGVQGTFATVTDPLAFFDFVPTYSGTNVVLTTLQLPFSNPAATGGVRNLVQQGGAIDRYAAGVTSNADFNTVIDQLLRLSPAQAIAAGHSMSGESYAAFTTVGLEQLDRFRMAALDAAGACESRGGELRGRYCAWADVYYVSASLDGSGDLAGYDYTLSGFQGGVETRVAPDAVVGASIGYGNQRMRNFEFAPRRFDGDALFAGIYGTYGVGPWQAVGLLGYSRFDVDAERDIGVGNIARQARSNFGGDGVNAAVALRYRAEFGGVRVVPEILMSFTQYWQDGLTETGAGSLNLRVQGTSANSFVTGIGVTASTDIAAAGVTLRPFATLRYEHDWLAGTKEDHRVTASFAAVPEAGSWTVFGQNRGQENLIGRIGLIGEVAANVALFGTAGAQWNTNGSEWGVGGGVRVTF
jgi:uncharacterized protein with beta-barrel porin domain